MTRGMRCGLVLAVVHVAIVGSLGVKLLADRATRPRVWVRTAPVDPDLPIRGRYVQLRLDVERFANMQDATRTFRLGNGSERTVVSPIPVRLSVRDGQLLAEGTTDRTGTMGRLETRGGRQVVRIDPVAFFIPEKAVDPSRRPAGEELWVEVTLPRRGGPRPIRLGVKKDGVLTPLQVR